MPVPGPALTLGTIVTQIGLLMLRVRTRIRELRQLGLPDWAATNLANTRKGPWRSAKVLAALAIAVLPS
jgi:hypothetical protein